MRTGNLFKPCKIFLLAGLLCALSVLMSVDEARATKPTESCTLQMDIKGAIGAATLDYFERALMKADRDNCSSILILINTPGGSLQTTRMIIEKMLNAKIPLICLVHPSGAHAGSAGAIILQACHISGAMVATNIGAATPVASTGQEIPEDLRKKLLNDTTSWLEGITKLRGRDLKFSRDIIVDAKAVSAKEALKLGAIDMVANKLSDILEYSQGKKIKLNATTEVTVQVGAIKIYEMDFRTQTLALIADPQIAYLMFMGSLGLLYFELTHPGTMVPGVIGGIGLVLSLISMHKLNVTWGAVALILLGLALLVAEAFVPSFGVLGIGGVASFVLGSVFLFDPETSGHSLPLLLIVPTAIFLGLCLLGIAVLAFRTRNVKKRGTYDELIGKIGKVVELKDATTGLIEVNGETWKFKSDSEISMGAMVSVNDHKGFTLLVTPANIN